MPYNDKLRVKVSEDKKETSLSIRMDESTVLTVKVGTPEFKLLVAHFQAQLKG